MLGEPPTAPSPTQARHRSLHTVGTYIRVDTAWDDNAATSLGL